MTGHYRPVDASAGGLFLETPGNGGLGGASLQAAAADASATIREVDAGGEIIGVLAALAKTADHLTPQQPLQFSRAVHVTIAGAGAKLILYGS